jgi:AcrR family transcriptional regulator
MPKSVDHERHRRELLGKCFDLFCRKGYSNVTMREIAREIGVSTGALYHYFPTKINILEQLFSWVLESDIGEYRRRADREAHPERKIGSIIEYWYGRQEYYRNLLLLATDLYRNSPESAEKIFGNFAEYYKVGIASSLGTNRRLSEITFNYLLGCVVHTLLAPDQFDYDGEVALVKDSLLYLLSNCGGARAGSIRAKDLLNRLTVEDPGGSAAANGVASIVKRGISK